MENLHYIEESGEIDENIFDNLKARKSKCSNNKLAPALKNSCDFEIVYETKEMLLNINNDKIYDYDKLTEQIKKVLEIISIRKHAIVLGWNTGLIGGNFYLRAAFSTLI